MSRKTVRFSNISYQQSVEGNETLVETKLHDGETQEKDDLTYVLIDYFYPFGKNKAGKKRLKRTDLSIYSSKRLKYLSTIIDGTRLRCIKRELIKLCKTVEKDKHFGICYRGKRFISTSQLPYIKDIILPDIRIKLKLLWTMN